MLMPDRHRLVVTVTAHYKNFPLLTFYGTALQILQTAGGHRRRRCNSSSTRCECRPRNESHQSCRTQHQTANPPPLPRGVPNGIQPTSAGKQAQERRSACAAADRKAAVAENKRANGTEVGFILVGRKRDKLHGKVVRPLLLYSVLRNFGFRDTGTKIKQCYDGNGLCVSRPPSPARETKNKRKVRKK